MSGAIYPAQGFPLTLSSSKGERNAAAANPYASECPPSTYSAVPVT